VTLDIEEQWRIIRVRVCERLSITPAEFDAIPYPDVCDLLEVWRADEATRSSPRLPHFK
jgi:hypothetical protein